MRATRHRLLREQPPRHSTCSSSTRSAIRGGSWATASHAGESPPATARARPRGGSMASTARFFDYMARGVPYGPDDGTHRPVGGGRVAAVRAGDRAADDRAFRRGSTREMIQPVRLQGAASIRPSRERGPGRVGCLRGTTDSIRGPSIADDRELPFGIGLGLDAAVPSHRHRTAARRIHRRLVIRSTDDGTIKKASAATNLFLDIGGVLLTERLGP